MACRHAARTKFIAPAAGSRRRTVGSASPAGLPRRLCNKRWTERTTKATIGQGVAYRPRRRTSDEITGSWLGIIFAFPEKKQAVRQATTHDIKPNFFAFSQRKDLFRNGEVPPAVQRGQRPAEKLLEIAPSVLCREGVPVVGQASVGDA